MVTCSSWVSVGLLALSFSVAGCREEREVHTTNDVALANSVRSNFTADHDAQGATSEVEVHAKDRIITLSGTVDTVADKALAERIARGTSGVLNVVNQIVVAKSAGGASDASFDEQAVREEALKGGEKVGPNFADARIYDAIRRKLVEHAGTSKKEILVDVVDGNVTLRGRFVGTTAARDEAVATALAIPGVKAVNDNLVVVANTSRP